jgi:hypothetical protein
MTGSYDGWVRRHRTDGRNVTGAKPRAGGKRRKFIWPDGKRLEPDQSVQHIQKQYPDFRRDWIEEYLIDWIDVDYAPEHYSQTQLDELDRLTARWIADHLRRAKTSKRQGRTHHS